MHKSQKCLLPKNDHEMNKTIKEEMAREANGPWQQNAREANCSWEANYLGRKLPGKQIVLGSKLPGKQIALGSKGDRRQSAWEANCLGEQMALGSKLKGRKRLGKKIVWEENGRVETWGKNTAGSKWWEANVM